MRFVVKPFDCGMLNGGVCTLDLPIGPRMLWLCGTMVNVVLGTSVLKCISTEEFALGNDLSDHWRCRSVSAWRGKLYAVAHHERGGRAASGGALRFQMAHPLGLLLHWSR